MAFFTLTLVRHGITRENKEHILQGQKDTKLSEEGIEQAKALSARLKDEVFSHVYSSDLQRAFKTAEISLGGKNVHLDKRLRERHFGVMDGKKTGYFQRVAKEAGCDRFEYTPLGGETTQQVKDRVSTFFEDLCQQLFATVRKGESLGNVIIFAHGGCLRLLILHFADAYQCELPDFNRKDRLGVSPNTGVSRFCVRLDEMTKKPVVTCSLLYCREHLDV